MRPLTLSDLWLPGSVLGGAMLDGWIGPWQVKVHDGTGHVWRSWWNTDGLGHIATRLDFRRPEVRDRAVRILGADALAIHAAEVKGDITPGEAAGLVWASVLRREAGLPVTGCVLGQWARDGRSTYNAKRSEVCGWGDEFRASWAAGTERRGWWFSCGIMGDRAKGREIREAGRAAADAAALAAGYSLREPDGILLLPLPDGIGRLETSNG